MADDDQLRDALTAAMAGFAAIVRTLEPDDFPKPSMCAGWSIHDVVDHIIAGDRFASLVLDGVSLADAAEQVVGVDHVGDDATAALGGAAANARTAFAGSLDRMVDHPVGEIPARRFLRFRVLDQLGHTWDIAEALGRPVTLDTTAVAVALEITEVERHMLDASEHFAMAAPEDVEIADPQTTFLRAIGRRPRK